MHFLLSGSVFLAFALSEVSILLPKLRLLISIWELKEKKKRLVTVILNILRTRWFHFNQLQIMDVMTDFNSDNLRWLSNVRFCSVIERNLKLYALLYFSFLFIFSFHSFWQFTALKQPFEIWVRQKWLVIPHISSSLNKCQSKSKRAYCSRAIRTN